MPRVFVVSLGPISCRDPAANPILAESVQFSRASGRRADLLAKLDIRTVGELIFHFPRSYDDLTNVQPMDKIEAGVLQTVQGEVVEIEGKELPDGRQIASVVIADPQGKCVAGVWFNSLMIVGKVRYGQKVAFSGKPKWYRDHWHDEPSARAGARRGRRPGSKSCRSIR